MTNHPSKEQCAGKRPHAVTRDLSLPQIAPDFFDGDLQVSQCKAQVLTVNPTLDPAVVRGVIRVGVFSIHDRDDLFVSLG
ncbi:hypothetical protein SAMN05216198_2060 [Halopseudomonas litoralis]|uniref:Uncharacterized protein n=1 Tax=Halopseudomonas litoralis TaxID=797277 RepID=A0A1H1SLP6_9GAMM|nr:hypothetical protein SAMN05216198_2060 [Halopseudomonas litoralis]